MGTRISRFSERIFTAFIFGMFVTPGLTPLILLVTKGWEESKFVRTICVGITSLMLMVALVAGAEITKHRKGHRSYGIPACRNNKKDFPCALFLVLSCIVSLISSLSPGTLEIWLSAVGIFTTIAILLLAGSSQAQDECLTFVSCPKCRQPLWWVKFWKPRKHCVACHDSRVVDKAAIAFGWRRDMILDYSEPDNCLVCKAREERIAAGRS